MSNEGKYVRMYRHSDDEEEAETSGAGRYVRAPLVSDEESGHDEHEFDDYDIVVDHNKQNEMFKQQLAKMQKAIEEITSMNMRSRERSGSNDAEESWTFSRNHPSSQANEYVPSIRWDQMKPFPKNIPANKMWEEWAKYIENFEIATTLSNANDPVRRSQLLFLSMGEELQGIVRAAKLRPNLNDSSCYRIFVKNVEEHLRSMTDANAEHEEFFRMRQERGETVVSFHARLMEKALNCRYGPSVLERFVHAQLLKGKND